jgi:hypothetical protein
MRARSVLSADGEANREHQRHGPIAIACGLQLDEARRIETATRKTGIEGRRTERPGSCDKRRGRCSTDSSETAWGTQDPVGDRLVMRKW